MSEGLNQYAVYRLRLDLKETRIRRHQTYRYLKEHHLDIRSIYYRELFLAEFDPTMTSEALRRQLEKELPADINGQTLGISDVLAITKDGITVPYYVDKDSLLPLTDFFHVASSTAVITMQTTDYQIEQHSGNWSAVEELWLDGHHFFLMQSQEFGRDAAYAVLDSHGRRAAQDTTKGFTEEIRRQLREYIQTQTSNPPEPSQEHNSFPADSTEKLPEKDSAEVANKEKGARYRTRRRRKGRIPLKRRQSVLKRLREYQKRLCAQFS